MLHKRSIPLPGNVLLTHVADASREAVRIFLGLEPSKAALLDWLLGPYHEATRFGPRRLITPAPEAMDLGGIVTGAQHEVRVTVRQVLSAQGADIARKLPPVVHILPAHDASGAHGFIPIDARGARLADRVIALVLADYLTRPDDFVARPIFQDEASSGERRSMPDAPTQPQMRAVRRN